MSANSMDLAFGRSAMWEVEAALLAEICRDEGDHVEVGALWGASAIIAAQNKPKPWHIYSIDVMAGGYWAEGDPGCPDKATPTARSILANFTHAGVAGRITLICAPSHPFPVPDISPATALIDAGHGADNVLQDWKNISPITSRFVALHDLGEKHSGVSAVVEDVVLSDPEWQQYRTAHSLLVMERK